MTFLEIQWGNFLRHVHLCFKWRFSFFCFKLDGKVCFEVSVMISWRKVHFMFFHAILYKEPGHLTTHRPCLSRWSLYDLNISSYWVVLGLLTIHRPCLSRGCMYDLSYFFLLIGLRPPDYSNSCHISFYIYFWLNAT